MQKNSLLCGLLQWSSPKDLILRAAGTAQALQPSPGGAWGAVAACAVCVFPCSLNLTR